METAVTGRMPWRVDHRRRHAGKFEHLGIGEMLEGRGYSRPFKVGSLCSKQSAQLVPRVPGHLDVVGVDVGGDSTRHDTIDATSVIDVTVGHEHRQRCEVEFCKKVSDPRRIRRCVDDHGWPTAVGADDICIGTEVPEGTRFDQHAASHPGSEHEAEGVVNGFYILEAAEDEFQRFAV